MPEGHVIHRIAETQSKMLKGDPTIVESPQGRFQKEADELSGRSLEKIDPHGKHLFYHFSGGKIVHIHLGLYGKYRQFENPPSPPRGAVRLRVIGRRSGFDLNGPNCCELIGEMEKQQVVNRLGEDPLKASADPQSVWRKVSASTKPIGSMLLDQSVIAGIGNIYRTELLFLERINPQTPANQISKAQFDNLWSLTCDLMKLGKNLNRIVTNNAFRKKLNGKSVPRERFNIYKRPHCPECGDYVYYWSLANRTVYACESCQPYSVG